MITNLPLMVATILMSIYDQCDLVQDSPFVVCYFVGWVEVTKPKKSILPFTADGVSVATASVFDTIRFDRFD